MITSGAIHPEYGTAQVLLLLWKSTQHTNGRPSLGALQNADSHAAAAVVGGNDHPLLSSQDGFDEIVLLLCGQNAFCRDDTESGELWTFLSSHRYILYM